MKVIVPLAGPEGETEKEFGDFKNLIEVYSKPLIKYIAEKRPYDLEKAVFILWSETEKKYNIISRLKKILGDNIETYILNSLTEGAACSVLEYLQTSNCGEDILVDLVDQYLSLDKRFISFIDEKKAGVNGIIPVFKSKYWKWSYVSLDKDGFVQEVQEKIDPPISDNATAGIYYFSSSEEYIRAARQMVRLDKRVKFNNKFFVSCVYNELSEKSVLSYPTQIVCPLGSVEGIRLFSQIAW